MTPAQALPIVATVGKRLKDAAELEAFRTPRARLCVHLGTSRKTRRRSTTESKERHG